MNKSANQIISTNQDKILSIELVRQDHTTREQINAPTTTNHQEKLLATNQPLILPLIRSDTDHNKLTRDNAIKFYSPASINYKNYTERLTVTIPKQSSPNIDRLSTPTPKEFIPIDYQGFNDYKIGDKSSKNSKLNSWVKKLQEDKKSKQNCLIM